MDEDPSENGITLVAKYGKSQHVLANLPPSTTVLDVKRMLCDLTRILPKRQKLIGLVTVTSSEKLSDETPLSMLTTKTKAAKKKAKTAQHELVGQQASPSDMCFILMGTPEEDILVDPMDRDDLPEVIDDFDLDFNAGSTEWLQHVANGENLKKFTANTSVYIMNEPRENKPLLVLDLDHTLLDFSSKTLQRDTGSTGAAANAMKRPHMDSFLTIAYQHYDLVVWSQTSWRWLETKLTELRMLTHSGYKFCFVLDKTSMFSIVSTKRDGTSHQHQVKPLQLIWSKYPRWGPHNTVHLDDLSRNFALNLSSGLKVTPYYRKKRNMQQRDVELLGLGKYLTFLAQSRLRFDQVDFSKWMDVVSGKLQVEAMEKKDEDKS